MTQKRSRVMTRIIVGGLPPQVSRHIAQSRPSTGGQNPPLEEDWRFFDTIRRALEAVQWAWALDQLDADSIETLRKEGISSYSEFKTQHYGRADEIWKRLLDLKLLNLPMQLLEIGISHLRLRGYQLRPCSYRSIKPETRQRQVSEEMWASGAYPIYIPRSTMESYLHEHVGEWVVQEQQRWYLEDLELKGLRCMHCGHFRDDPATEASKEVKERWERERDGVEEALESIFEKMRGLGSVNGLFVD